MERRPKSGWTNIGTGGVAIKKPTYEELEQQNTVLIHENEHLEHRLADFKSQWEKASRSVLEAIDWLPNVGTYLKQIEDENKWLTISNTRLLGKLRRLFEEWLDNNP